MTIYGYLIRKENPRSGTRTFALSDEGKKTVFSFLSARQLDLTDTDFKMNKAGQCTGVIGGNCAPYQQMLPEGLDYEFYREHGEIVIYDSKREMNRAFENDKKFAPEN